MKTGDAIRIVVVVLRLAWAGTLAACGRVHFDPLDVPSDAGTTADAQSGPSISCVDLPSICGATGTSPCCGTGLVAGGAFYRGYDVGTDGAYPDMTNPATISPFQLDTHEVTVGRFRRFVDAGMGTQQQPPPAGAGARHLNGSDGQGGWDPAWSSMLEVDATALAAAMKIPTGSPWTDAPGPNEALPIGSVSWFEAFAFCAWDGGFLPTEAEWNYAASGGDEQRAYPWSTPPSSLVLDCSYANYYDGQQLCGGTGLIPVGSDSPRGDGRWGHADLAGNVSEWTLDWFAGGYLNPCEDCASLTPGSERIFRDAAWRNLVGDPVWRAGEQYLVGPSYRTSTIGFRCARLP